MGIEEDFDISFVAKLTSEEKQIQQNYRPIIGIHKWFARRPGALFRSLLLSEFSDSDLKEAYFSSNSLEHLTICDPFMGGGTTIFESNRVGCNAIGFDINPMAYWIVRQELSGLNRADFRIAAETLLQQLETAIGKYYQTICIKCDQLAKVKYFLWVKQLECKGCGEYIDLFPGYLVAENVRHTSNVIHCPWCKALVEHPDLDRKDCRCTNCKKSFNWTKGTANKSKYTCNLCHHVGNYQEEIRSVGAPRHRLFGIEYHCVSCKPTHVGRFFKTPDSTDLKTYDQSSKKVSSVMKYVPDEKIPDGDETKRLHRWGYKKYRDMFNDRQLLSLGSLSIAISSISDANIRHALATVFSDFIRYQNMLCRYDTYALKCQDIFAVHGFPVGLVQCENNVIGINRIGSGGFRHFIEKFDKAKAYAEMPFETIKTNKKKQVILIDGEVINGIFTNSQKMPVSGRGAWLNAGSLSDTKLKKDSLDAVFTDPPYYDNIQYAELIDFCYVWLRKLLPEVSAFSGHTTRSLMELTGNSTTGKGLDHFTEGLSKVFSCASKALKAQGPFAFTYHHNAPLAYTPIIVAILNAQLVCTKTIPCPAEMSASLHISGTKSSVLDSVFVCRKSIPAPKVTNTRSELLNWLRLQCIELKKGGITCTKGDLTCISLGHLAMHTINSLASKWQYSQNVINQLEIVETTLLKSMEIAEHKSVIEELLI